MTQLLKLTSKIILVSLVSAYLMSCTGGNVSSSFGSSSAGSLVDNIPDGMSSGIADPSQMYVGVDSTINDIAHVHTEGVFGTNCAIDPASSLQDVRCIVDIPEAEIYNHGLALKYNVPSGMCRYLRTSTYWFYNHEVGTGPTSIVINRTLTDGVLTASSCRFNGGMVNVACNTDPEVLIDPQGPTITCRYNYSGSGGKNGCLGDYTLTVNTTTIVTTPFSSTSSTSTSALSWGKSVSEIIGGAGKYGWPVSKDGYPIPVVYPAHLGIFNQSYTIPAPILSILNNTNLEIANFSTPAMNTHDGYVSASTSNLPYAVDPIDDLNGTAVEPGSDSYQYECLDQADEILHRIKVYVREWDTYQDYYDYITTKGTTEIPDRRVGSEGGTCVGLDGPCNDYIDFDDIAALFVSYTTNPPAAPFPDVNMSRRRAYFPQLTPK